MKVDNLQDIYQLSPVQQGILFHSLQAPDSQMYCVELCYSFRGMLDVEAFVQAWQNAFRKYSALRTSFYWEDLETPVQVVANSVQFPLTQHDWQGLTDQQQQARLAELQTAERQRGFDLSVAPLTRLHLIQFAPDSYQFLWSKHHLILDGWSTALVLKEVFQTYAALCQGQPLPVASSPSDYKDYIVWLQQQDLSPAAAFWRRTLQGVNHPTPLVLPAPRDRGDLAPAHPEATRQLSTTTTAALQAFARAHQLTLNTLIQGAWALLLSRYSGETDVIYGATVSGRPADLPGAEAIVGVLINTLPVRVHIEPEQPLLPWLKQLQSQLVEMRQYEYSPLVEVQGWSEIPRGQPLFESIVVFENYPVDAAVREWQTKLAIQKVSARQPTNYPLTVTVAPGPALEIRVAYDRDRFSRDGIERLLGHFAVLLEGMIAHPDQPLGHLPLLTPEERHQQLVVWNDTKADYPQSCVHERFAAQAAQRPESVAVVWETEQLTYRELNQRANQLAHYLQSLGVRPGDLVGICVPRSPAMVIALLAVLKAGGAYVPLDPAYPQQRLAFILAETQVPLLITQTSLQSSLPESPAAVICLDRDGQAIAQHSDRNPDTSSRFDALAYVIYTSGSTGQPKGVQIPHRALANFLSAMAEQPGLTADDTLVAVTTLSFDIAALELFLPLITGARVVLVSREVASDGRRLSDAIAEAGATVMQATPATWKMLLDAGWQGSQELKILCGGEALSRPLANQLQARSKEVWNLYGPTETTVWSAVHRVTDAPGVVPIGRPIANTQFYLLDRNGQPVPVGVPGELYIGGAGLARGYFQRPQLTAAQFVTHPVAEGRLYRTGDLMRYLPDGNLEFLGRLDRQVKIRGFRIELGEIETVLHQYPGLRDAVVVVREDRPDKPELVAYLIGDRAYATPDLRAFLAKQLPAYMIPTAFVQLAAFPLTPNGKIDRQALPAPRLSQSRVETTTVEPRTPIEAALVEIWASVLDCESPGVHDNFFDLGGHSLLATQLIARIRDRLAVEISVRHLFEAPTIAALATLLDSDRQSRQGLDLPPIAPVDRSQALPLSFTQQRLWVLSQLEGDRPTYNIPGGVRIAGALNVPVLKRCLEFVIQRHESLRTCFPVVEGQPVQKIVPAVDFPLPVIDLQTLSAQAQEARVQQLSEREAQQPFDLTAAPLIRATLLRLAPEEHILLLTLHHIISDGWSQGIIIKELAALYPAFLAGEPSPLPELPIQYADFAHWQRQCLAPALKSQLAYWQQQLAGELPVLQLPSDRPRPLQPTASGALKSFSVNPHLARSLKALCREEGVTLYMLLLAAFKTLLYRYTGEVDILVGSPIANRGRAEIEGLVGAFINTIVVRTDLSGHPGFQTLLQRVKAVALAAYEHQDVPFEWLLNELSIERDLTRTPLFQVLFSLQNAPMPALELGDLSLQPLLIDNGTTKLDLALFMQETATGIGGVLKYRTDVFDSATIDRMLSHFQRLLQAIVERRDQSISELPLLSAEEQHQQLVTWNQTQANYPCHACLHECFEAQVERTPDRVAVVFAAQQLSYRELNRRANQLAHYLRESGVGTETIVGLCVEPSLEMVIGLLGILKAGGAYLPLDPAYPAQRLAFMVADAQVSIVLTLDQLKARLPKAAYKTIICLDRDWDRIDGAPEVNPTPTATADNLAYVLYTSGSTGTPKGVLGIHRGLVSRLSWEAYPWAAGEVCAQKTSLNFIDSLWEIFAPLLRGLKTAIIPRAIAQDPQQLVATLAQQQVTRLVLVPSLLRALLETVPDLQHRLPKLKYWVSSGESLSPELAQRFTQIMPQAVLLNIYGASEFWDATCYDTQNRQLLGNVPIGHPIANRQVYILDRNLQPVPIGVVGELYIGGDGLVRGYLNRPQLTAEKFISHPFRRGERLYKTGDLGYFLPDGTIVYLNRLDRQVKIRGFRVEIGEVETVISQNPHVREAVVVAKKEKSGNQCLIAYIVPKAAKVLTTSQWHEYLQQSLPNPAIPAAFVALEKLPLTPNGKIDHSRLPDPDIQLQSASESVPPSTSTEKELAAIWTELLGIKQVGIHDNFFMLGGHSLTATQLLSRVRSQFGVEISLRDFFSASTIASLAEIVEMALLSQSPAAEELLNFLEADNADEVSDRPLFSE